MRLRFRAESDIRRHRAQIGENPSAVWMIANELKSQSDLVCQLDIALDPTEK